jgi:hypothetical protein
VIRTPLKAIQRPTGSDAFKRAGESSSDEGSPQDIKVPCRVQGIKKDGQVFPAVFAQSALGDSRILSHFMDITNQVQVEELEKQRQKKQGDALKEEKQKLEEDSFCLEGNTLPLHWFVVFPTFTLTGATKKADTLSHIVFCRFVHYRFGETSHSSRKQADF